MVHRSPSGFEIRSYFECTTWSVPIGLRSDKGLPSVFKPCSLSGTVLLNKYETVEIVLLNTTHLIDLNAGEAQTYFGAYLLNKR